MNLLSVDWDFFFKKVERPEDGERPDGKNDWLLYDWGHKESPFLIGPIWGARATGFLMHNVPLPQTTGEEDGFWSRFSFAPGAILYYAESHSFIGRTQIVRDVESIWNFDAHHDCGYKPDAPETLVKSGRIHCDDWGIYADMLDIDLHLRYPRWRHYALEEEETPQAKIDRQVDNGQPVPIVFDRVFLCRSGAWVPPWLDDRWRMFLADAPLKKKRQLGLLADRPWNQDEAEAAARVKHMEGSEAQEAIRRAIERHGTA